MNDNNTVKERFFRWIRSTGVMRGDDRWLGGVCSGIAVRLGWSPTLTRALLLASTLLFGFGAALYAFAWALLPDCRDGRILAEELLAGRWDWNCIGMFIMIAIAVMIPGAGWVAILVAALVLWAICQSSVRQQHGYGFGARNARRDGGSGPGPYGPYGPQQRPQPGPYGPYAPQGSQPGAQPGPYGPYAPQSPARSPYGGPQGGAAGPVGPVDQKTGPIGSTGPGPQGAAPVDSRTARPASGPSPSPAATAPPLWQAGEPNGPMNGPADGSHPGAPYGPHGSHGPAFAASPAASSTVLPPQPKPRRLRRKPAGPLVVLAVLGVTLVSAAVTLMQVGDGFTDVSIDMMFRQSTVWISGVCIMMGLVLVVLGARGRRSGGLIPLALVAGFTACCMIAATAAYAYTTRGITDASNNDAYAKVDLGGDYYESSNADGMVEMQYIHDGYDYWVSDSSPKTYDRLKQGVSFKGTGYADSKANIDLSRYDRWNHSDVNTYVKGCPAGQINLIVVRADVQVTLPDDCPYSFGRNGELFNAGSTLGGWGTLVRDGYVLMSMPGGDPYGNWSGNGTGYNDDWYNNGTSDDDVSFQINFVAGNGGRISVKYASASKRPSYVESVRQYTPNGDFSGLDATTRRHYNVETGGADPSAASGDAGKSDTSGKSDQSDTKKEDSHE